MNGQLTAGVNNAIFHTWNRLKSEGELWSTEKCELQRSRS